ncbi:MAG: hypothetical protein DID90_2727553679 [Candidatus Nitrotoga sp. LAW]|nr:MAG: hypothetical protein DID90_2727553679 [Candidatus Nitrotoga sp. LAW]
MLPKSARDFDSEARKQLHTITDKVISINAQRVAKEKY